jgi:hypothetical protein
MPQRHAVCSYFPSQEDWQFTAGRLEGSFFARLGKDGRIMRRIPILTLLAVLGLATAAHGVDIPLGNDIDGVTPSGDGSSATPWVYDFGGTDLGWGTDTASHTAGTASWTTFTNVANVTSSGSGGTVDKGGSNFNGDVGELVIDASGVIDVGGYLSTANTRSSNNALSDAGDMTISGGTSISIGADGDGYSILAWARRSKGEVRLYSSGAITLAGGVKAHGSTQPTKGPGGLYIQQNSGGGSAGAVSIGGDVLLWHGSGDRNSGGPLSVMSSGAVSISGDVITYGHSGVGGSVWVGGDVDITAGGTVSISGVNGIDARLRGDSSHSNAQAGDVTIETSSGNIDIDGGVDLNLETGSGGRDGRLSLTNTDVLGEILLGTLDLDKVQYAIFDAAGGSSTIEGALLNFTSGTDKLRTPDGQKVFYDPASNPSLGGLTYDLFAPDGVSDGGVLTPIIPEPATMTMLGLGGLMGLTGLVRRRRR